MNQQLNPLITELTRSVFDSMYRAIDQKDIGIFRTITSFIYSRLTRTYETKNKTSFTTFSYAFSNCYEYALEKLKQGNIYLEIFDTCADSSARSLKERLLSFENWRYDDNAIISIEKQKLDNEYIEILLNRFADIVYFSLKNKQSRNLKFQLAQLSQVVSLHNRQYLGLKLEIDILKGKNQRSDNDEGKLTELEEKFRVDSFKDSLVRKIYKVSLFWSFYLYQLDIYTYDDIKEILSLFESYDHYISDEFLTDIIDLRNYLRSDNRSWDRWDYVERPDGVVYSPPTPSHWVTFGAVAYLAVKSQVRYYDLQNLDSREINRYTELLDSMNQIVSSDKIFSSPKWEQLLIDLHKDNHLTLLKSLKNQLDGYKQRADSKKAKQLAASPLSVELVRSTERILKDGWAKSDTTVHLFENFQSIEYQIKRENNFLYVGQINQVWLGMRSGLVADNSFYIPHLGLERLGETMADHVESAFLIKAVTAKENIQEENAITGIDAAIKRIKHNEYNPSLIILGYDVWNREFYSLSHSKFTNASSGKHEHLLANYGGTYDGIPIVKVRGNLMQGSVIVTDFQQSFSLELTVNNLEEKEYINIQIKEISAEVAKKFVQEKPNYWKRELTEEEAVTKLQNSVLLDFYAILDFKIKSKNALEVISLSS